MDRIDAKKWLKRQTKNKILFRLTGMDKRAWKTITNSPAGRSFIETKYGDKIECIANDDLEIALDFHLRS